MHHNLVRNAAVFYEPLKAGERCVLSRRVTWFEELKLETVCRAGRAISPIQNIRYTLADALHDALRLLTLAHFLPSNTFELYFDWDC
jgi:hypothetical protein